METVVIDPVPKIGTLIEKFCQDCKLRNMTEESIRRYKSSLMQFASCLQDFDLTNLSIQMLEKLLSYLKFERKVKHKTIKNVFSALSTFYDYLVFYGYTNQNLVLPFRKRYLRMYKKGDKESIRKLISIEEASQLINSILDPRDKAIAVLLAKTGVRRSELLNMDVDNIDWNQYSITLKPTPKRSNLTIYFDDECALVLKRWLKVREKVNPKSRALFISYRTQNRLSRNGAYQAVVKYAQKLGLHTSESPKLEDHFGPHCFRHWFTTWLLRNGMPREYVKELRGDKRSNRHIPPHRQGET